MAPAERNILEKGYAHPEALVTTEWVAENVNDTGNYRIVESDDVVAYCRIGERSSHTWFVLSYLLGYDNVRNYDGSWTEWGNMVAVPIEKDV